MLVVEDYEPLRRSLVRGFTEAGAAVDATGDGEEGLWYAADGAYDAIVLDLMLPKLDGLTLLRRIRAKGNRTPVIILTAKDQVPDRVRGLDEGSDDYMVKPFAFAELLARVRALVRRKYQLSSPSIEIGPLRIDLNARSASLDSRPLSLTAMEYGVLELLAMRAGQVVSRADIVQHLYGFDCEPDSNTVDVHMAQLRKKLAHPSRSSFIETRRGMGYSLSAGEPG
jgi:DNA-binding response OmpR family regulator